MSFAHRVRFLAVRHGHVFAYGGLRNPGEHTEETPINSKIATGAHRN